MSTKAKTLLHQFYNGRVVGLHISYAAVRHHATNVQCEYASSRLQEVRVYQPRAEVQYQLSTRKRQPLC